MGDDLSELDAYIYQLKAHKRVVERLLRTCSSTLQIVGLQSKSLKFKNAPGDNVCLIAFSDPQIQE